MFLLIAIVAVMMATVSSAVAPEKALAKHLIKSYEELGIAGRPVKNVADGVKLDLGLTLFRIVKADQGYVVISAFLSMMWNDPFLTWDPKDYGNTQSVVIPAKSIWTPDITSYNDMYQGAKDLRGDMESADVLVMNDGTVYWIPRVTLKALCLGNGKREQQTCSFIFGSWAHDSKQIQVKFNNDKADFDMSAFEPTPGTEIVRHSASLVDKEYDCCPGTKYTSATFTLDIKKVDYCDSKTGIC